MEKPYYKLRTSDFVPLLGYLNYGIRNGTPESIDIKKLKCREKTLFLYNITMIVSLISGLEKIVR